MFKKLFKSSSVPKKKGTSARKTTIKSVPKKITTAKTANTVNPGSPKKKPVPNKGQIKPQKRKVTVPTNTKASNNPNIEREFRYTKPLDLSVKKEVVQDVKVETVTDERLIMKRPVLETVSDLNDVSIFNKISLVNYFNLKESGKIDERIAREEYRRNTARLKKETSLLYFLRESAKRHLEHNETKGYRKIDIRIDPQYSLEDIEECIQSKLLASYETEIIHNNDLLSKMGVDPIIIRMTLKKM